MFPISSLRSADSPDQLKPEVLGGGMLGLHCWKAAVAFTSEIPATGAMRVARLVAFPWACVILAS